MKARTEWWLGGGEGPGRAVPVKEVAALFRCGRCNEAPFVPPAHICLNSHLVCSKCFQQERSPRCHKCGRSVDGRNTQLEEVLRNLSSKSCKLLETCSPPVSGRSSELSLDLLLEVPPLDPATLSQLPITITKLQETRVQTEDGPKTPSVSSSATSLPALRLSHRPVLCPYPCGRIITFSALYPHFEMQHPHVPLVKIVPDFRHDVCLPDFSFLKVNDYLCQAVFIVHLDPFNRTGIERSYSTAEMLRLTRSSQEMLRRHIFFSTLSVGRLHVTGPEDSYFLAVWCTCLHESAPLTYTVHASGYHSNHSATFTGPLVSLHGSQEPADVYERGECLLLSSGLLKELQSRLDKSFRLTVTFSSPPVLPTDADTPRTSESSQSLYKPFIATPPPENE